jgi:hypothetical protein
MNELLKATIDAHGGLDRWHELDAVSARLLQDGAEWALKGQGGNARRRLREGRAAPAARLSSPLWVR